MKIQIASDLHLEFSSTLIRMPNPVPNITAPVLCLLGDIGIPSKSSYKDFLLEKSNVYEVIFVIAGNHEFYGGEYEEKKELMKQICSSIPNVVFLDKTSYLYQSTTDPNDAVRVLGCTLWSHVPDENKNAVSRT
jgi:hypothetical protein